MPNNQPFLRLVISCVNGDYIEYVCMEEDEELAKKMTLEFLQKHDHEGAVATLSAGKEYSHEDMYSFLGR